MADVQLEHGYIRVANRIVEALLASTMTGLQLRIVLGLVRLTYGWRRKTVTVTAADLAEKLNTKPTGGFRRLLDELLREGVLVRVGGGFGPHPATYMVQKDFTRWGRFASAPERLAALYDERPANADDLLVTQPAPPEADAPTGADDMPPQGQDMCPLGGNSFGAKSLNHNELEGGKDRKDRKDTSLSLRVRETLADKDRQRFDQLMLAVPDPDVWAAEMLAMLDAMPGHTAVLPDQLALAITDYFANGAAKHPVMQQFRRYVRRVVDEPVHTPRVNAPQVQQEAERVWALCKQYGFLQCSRHTLDGELARAHAAGDIADVAAFKATLHRLDRNFLRQVQSDRVAMTAIAEKLGVAA